MSNCCAEDSAFLSAECVRCQVAAEAWSMLKVVAGNANGKFPSYRRL